MADKLSRSILFKGFRKELISRFGEEITNQIWLDANTFLFCFIGYFNGTGSTLFVMLQGIIGAFGVRLPVSWFVSRQAAASLFHIGLATPASSLVQIILCGVYFVYALRKQRQQTLQ